MGNNLIIIGEGQSESEKIEQIKMKELNVMINNMKIIKRNI